MISTKKGKNILVLMVVVFPSVPKMEQTIYEAHN